MSEITGGELLLRCLHAEGIQYVNAITDGTYMMVIEAIERSTLYHQRFFRTTVSLVDQLNGTFIFRPCHCQNF